ncbi:MAG: DUF3500 domain-containing protein [Verrucomicrobiota bacterium]
MSVRPAFLRPLTLGLCLTAWPSGAETPVTAPAPPAESAAAEKITADAAVGEMTAAAKDLLAALDDAQRAKAVFKLTDDERLNWHFVPFDRKGLPLGDLRPDQDHLVYGLLGTALSSKGLRKATTIMSFEKILHDLENGNPGRNPEKYFVSIFGEPKAGQAWGWRFEGHHLAFNFTIAADATCRLTPTMLGANPGELKDGPRAGLRALAQEEDLGRALAASLTPEQRRTAVLPGAVPADVITGQKRKVDPLHPDGIASTALTAPQREILWKVIEEYVGRFRPDLTEGIKSSLKADGGHLTFAWSGGLEPGEGHYYRIQSPQFLIEYDNTQNNAKHPHAVWRDFNGDFGMDLLKAHYQQEHPSN